MSAATSVSPFPEGVLLQEHQAEVTKIRTCLKNWISGANDIYKKVPGAVEKMNTATDALFGLEVAEPYAFPSPPQDTFRGVLLSCIRCYWLATIASLDSSEKDEMRQRLDLTPGFGNRIPRFDGQKCVETPGLLSEREYEGLMRMMHLVTLGLVPEDVVRIWYEIGEVGVQTWEEEGGERQEDPNNSDG